MWLKDEFVSWDGEVFPCKQLRTGKKIKYPVVTASLLYKHLHKLIRLLLLKVECCEKYGYIHNELHSLLNLFLTGMSDFQYLAMHSGPDGKQTSMYDKVLMLKPEKEEFFNRELPLYIPPPIFSRLDTPVDYFYRPDIQHRLVPFLIM